MPRDQGLPIIEFVLSYEGGDADSHYLDLYDGAQALIGFQRSIALTTHLVLNGQIITQSPSLKGARIIASPVESGSWKITAGVIFTGTMAVAHIPSDNPIGHLLYSAYDYLISESLGFHVDYEKTIGQLYEEEQLARSGLPKVEQHQLDSLVEKCSNAVIEIHRPISKSQSALTAEISSQSPEDDQPLGELFNIETFRYMLENIESPTTETIRGRVSSYNSNTYKGRIFVSKEGRPVSFDLLENCRSTDVVDLIVKSLSANAVQDPANKWARVYFRVRRITSRKGTLKKYRVIAVSHERPDED